MRAWIRTELGVKHDLKFARGRGQWPEVLESLASGVRRGGGGWSLAVGKALSQWSQASGDTSVITSDAMNEQMQCPPHCTHRVSTPRRQLLTGDKAALAIWQAAKGSLCECTATSYIPPVFPASSPTYVPRCRSIEWWGCVDTQPDRCKVRLLVACWISERFPYWRRWQVASTTKVGTAQEPFVVIPNFGRS